MTFNEMVDSVGQITKRPERIAQIQLALAKATLKFHSADFFNRDIKEVKGDWTEISGNRFMILTSGVAPGFRKIAYLNGYDDVTDSNNPRVMQQFEETSPAQIRDEYGYMKTNVYYFAGETITCWPGSTFGTLGMPALSWQTGLPPKFLMGYYQSPKVSPSDYKSWIAELVPFALIDEACAEIFGSIGDADEAARRKKDFQTVNLPLVRMQDIQFGV